jgi:excisionase family DNA binding protein
VKLEAVDRQVLKMTEQSEWVSLGEAAGLLGVHPTTLRTWADQGEIPSQRTPGGHRRFQRQVIDQWMQTRIQPGDATASEAQLMLQSALGSEEARQTHRELGRSLLELLTKYLAETDNKAALLREVQRLGGQYAQHTRTQGLTLGETVQAFLFFRDLLTDTVIQLAEVLSLRTPNDWGNRLRAVNHLTDEFLLAVIEGYSPDQR